MPEAVRAYIAMGGNQGGVLAAFAAALAALEQAGVRVVGAASAYRTVAWVPPAAPAAPDYWNTVCAVETTRSPDQLLTLLLAIERRAGRERRQRWAARTLDLDLLLYDTLALQTPRLTLPHRGLAARPFVLRPLCELAPDAMLPDGKRARELLGALADPDAGILERRRGWLSGDGDGATAAAQPGA